MDIGMKTDSRRVNGYSPTEQCMKEPSTTINQMVQENGHSLMETKLRGLILKP